MRGAFIEIADRLRGADDARKRILLA